MTKRELRMKNAIMAVLDVYNHKEELDLEDATERDLSNESNVQMALTSLLLTAMSLKYITPAEFTELIEMIESTETTELTERRKSYHE